MISELILLCLATCLACIFAFFPLIAEKIKAKNPVLHTYLYNMKTQMFLKDVLSTGTSQWSNESGLWSLGGYVREEGTTTLSCFHVLLLHSPYLPKKFCCAYSRLNFNPEQHSKRRWIQSSS